MSFRLIFLMLFYICTIENALTSPNIIESKWYNFELLIKNRFSRFFDKHLIEDLNRILNQEYEDQISINCKTSLQKLASSLGEMKPWAVKMFDASAKLPVSGLLEGTVTDLGQFDECLSISVPSHYTGQSQSGQYCTLRIKPALPDRPLFNTIHDKIPQLSGLIKNVDKNHSQWLSDLAKNAQYFYFTSIRLGICLPSACSSLEINQMLSFYFDKNFALEANIAQDGCETLEQVNHTKKFGAKQWIASVILSTFGLLVVFGSLEDGLDLNANYQSFVMLTKRLIKHFCLKDHSVEEEKNRLIVSKCKLFVWLECFSIQKNLPILTNVGRDKEDAEKFTIEVIHGVKVFAMSWVILGHTYGLINPENHDKIFVSAQIYSDIFFQPFLNATLSVNTFFAVSGLLTSFTLLKNRDKMNNFLSFFMAFMLRLFRLLPPYIALICVTMLFAQMRAGPLWIETVQKPVISNCEQSYWTNLIFLNNFVNTRQMCLMHTWYLSIDMQFYMIGLLIFYIFLRNKQLSFLIMLASSVIATAYCALVTYFNNYPPTILASAPAVTERWNYILDFYYKPYCHLSSYLGGFYFGYSLFLAQTGEEKNWLHKIRSNLILRSTMNIFMAVLGLLALFSTWPFNAGLPVPQSITAIHAATFRFCWSLSLLWFIYILTIERSGSIYQFLTWAGWRPISKLSYSAFLFHPLVIWWHFGTVEHRLSSNHLEFIRMFAANLVLSLVLALISSLIFEAPTFALQRLIFQNKRKLPKEIKNRHFLSLHRPIESTKI